MTDRRTWLKEFLPRTPFFGGLNTEQLERVMDMLVERTFKSEETIFCEGDQGCSMYIVETGQLVARQQSEQGTSIKLMRLMPGDFFGETTLIEMHPRPFTARAETDVVLHELTNMNLYELYKSDVKAYVMVLQNMNRELCRRLREASNRVTQMAGDLDEGETTQFGLQKFRLPPDFGE